MTAINYFYNNYLRDIGLDEIECCMDSFFMIEDKETMQAFTDEVEAVYMEVFNGTLTMQEAADIYIGRKLSEQSAEDVVRTFYELGGEKRKFRTIWYFFHNYLGLRIDWLAFKNSVAYFMAWENMESLKKQIAALYIGNDTEPKRHAAYIESRIEKLSEWGNEERIREFQKEIDAFCALIPDQALIREAAHRLGGDIKVPVKKAVSVIKLLYDKSTQKIL